jgi:uncharacterized cofD-like protein
MAMERITAPVSGSGEDLRARLNDLSDRRISPLDLLPQEDLREKLVDLVLNGQPRGADRETSAMFSLLRNSLIGRTVDDTRVVVFGGGSGLSNIIGGDSRREGWLRRPFSGLKEVFPLVRSVVCVTDDGGSTGELLKDLPLVAIGDLRHVLLSSIQLERLQKRYALSVSAAGEVAATLSGIFNYRFANRPDNPQAILEDCGVDLQRLPPTLREYLEDLIRQLFVDARFSETLGRPHCLGNLLLAAAVYRQIEPAFDNRALCDRQDLLHDALLVGLNSLALYLGAVEQAVLPCTSTPAQLRLVYTNGVQITGESKSSLARRGVPVDRVFVDFNDNPVIYDDIMKNIREADVLILAPGSLYSSIIPIFSVPGLADCVRENRHALKVLVSNLWVQAGETDLSIVDPQRKFHVSDMIRAYERNIPGGTAGLFHEVLCLSLRDVPASVLQRYAVEGKVPIYLDRAIVKELGYTPLECGIFSKEALAERGVIQHDPAILAQAIKALYITGEVLPEENRKNIPGQTSAQPDSTGGGNQSIIPCLKYRKIKEILANIKVQHQKNCDCLLDVEKIRDAICDIIWKHQDIPLAHLRYIRGIRCIDLEEWRRDQRWDNVFSFFAPGDQCIMIRSDQFEMPQKLEVAFLIALGESLLGDYARDKVMEDVVKAGLRLGKVYHLRLQDEKLRTCYFSDEELHRYLSLARMLPSDDPCHFTRLINGNEGFTPPGLLMGLMYAWYLENRLASHIEYKMTITRIRQSDLIPEQLKMVGRRKQIISFFREVVFSATDGQGDRNPHKNGYLPGVEAEY